MSSYDYKEDAQMYDEQVKEYNSFGHDILFGLSYEFVNKNQSLLDLGIGTGLASSHFANLGLEIFGLDISDEMINICRSKGFTNNLFVHDFYKEGIPFEKDSFNHVISCGVFHFLGNLNELFENVKKVLKPDGIFAFSFAPSNIDAAHSLIMTSWGVPITKHSSDYIECLLAENNFELLKEQRLLMKGADKINYDVEFSVIVSRVKR